MLSVHDHSETFSITVAVIYGHTYFIRFEFSIYIVCAILKISIEKKKIDHTHLDI